LRAVFVTGKGGTGKSTVSASLARQLAASGFDTLVVSFDPAHNLCDIFGRSLDRRRRVCDRLEAEEIDLDRAAARYIDENLDVLTATYGYLKPLDLDAGFGALRYAPGVEEYAALVAMERLVREETGRDYVVIDTPPTGQTLRILALPSVTLGWLERLVNLRRRILQKRYTIHAIAGSGGVETPATLPHDEKDDAVLRTLLDMQRRYGSLQAFLRSEHGAVTIVFNPDYLSRRETERLVAGLNELELPLRLAFHNKTDPGDAAGMDAIESALREAGCRAPFLRIPRDGALAPGSLLLDRPDLAGAVAREWTAHG
jgi:arsenite-transporting ATPase